MLFAPSFVERCSGKFSFALEFVHETTEIGKERFLNFFFRYKAKFLEI